jgi:sarcosine oxidase subunit beta
VPSTQTTPDVIVIGGGLHGCSAALHLAMRGATVTVIEKDHVARHASGVNAGGVRRLGRDIAEIPLSVASLELWYRIQDLVDDDCGFEHHGQVKVAENEAELETLRRRAAELRALGYEHEEIIDRTELRALVPAIAEHCVGGIVSRADGAANPYRTTVAFRRKAENLGVRFVEGERVTRLVRNGRRWRVEAASGGQWDAAVVVNCAGAWADRIAAQLGEPVPLEVGRPLSFKQYANGTVLIGGGHKGRARRDENWTDLDMAGLARSARTVSELFPIMRSAPIVRGWAGIEGRLPDDIPVIGPSSTEAGVFHAFAFAGHGFQLGPVVGGIIAELITTGHSNLPITPFRIDRFGKQKADAA